MIYFEDCAANEKFVQHYGVIALLFKTIVGTNLRLPCSLHLFPCKQFLKLTLTNTIRRMQFDEGAIPIGGDTVSQVQSQEHAGSLPVAIDLLEQYSKSACRSLLRWCCCFHEQGILHVAGEYTSSRLLRNTFDLR